MRCYTKCMNLPVSFEGLVNPRPLDVRLHGPLLGHDDDISDVSQTERTIGQPEKTMYIKSRKLFDENLR